MNLDLILTAAALVLAIGALLVEYKRTLMMLQQNSYRPERYRKYLQTSGETTSWSHLLAMVIALGAYLSPTPTWLAACAIGLYSLYSIAFEVGKKYKKPLVWTPRAKRIYGVMLVVPVVAVLLTLIVPAGSIAQMLRWMAVWVMAAYCLSPGVAMFAVWALKPVEKHINNGYINDARRILQSMPGLTVIGITGSYGKTSTKHYLNRILSEKFSVCMTPGSFNTTLGVVRTVREYLKPYNEVFICEMGAKNLGDIKEICDLVHPSIGIVTAVGPQHLESFKTIENVQRTKFELIDALPKGGLAVVNDDFEYVANRPVENVAVVRYGIKPRPEVKFAVGSLSYSATGTDFNVLTPDGELKLHTRLVGECNVSNLVAAVIVALHLGVSEQQIRYAVEKIEQVEHRLSVKRTPGGITIIDDAFNSNPTGSGMALDVLAAMRPGKRIVITPGMIELGDRQEELNEEFGRKIARSVDVAIIVGQYNRDAILEGIGTPEGVRVEPVDSFADAQRLLATIAASGDTVLYENDLPDTFK